MKKEYTWHINAKNTPTLKRKCNHCSSNRFYCSDKFRVNAQKKNLDVWLIYRCVECDSTYNLTILSRTKPELIGNDMLHRLSHNDEALAWQYAFSVETARRNSVEPDYSSVDYEIQHDNISINDIASSEYEIITFKVRTDFEFGLKLTSVIRSCLGLSASQLKRLIEAGAIYMPDGYPVKKRRVKDGDVVVVKTQICASTGITNTGIDIIS